MTPEERTEQRAAIKAVFDSTFGPGHESSADLGAMLRIDGDTSSRFSHDGAFWELRRAAGQFTLTQV